ncbi:MAG: TonB-dependent receptor [Flavobacteriales bacterium]|jgi:Fe(3+) dicitrate transport protein|nr:TonB-dependent receptor [Flavobacteriales bacterium]
MNKWFLIFLSLIFQFSIAQVLFEGQVKDRKTNQIVPFASVQYGEKYFTECDADGMFRFKIPRGKKTLIISSVGYHKLTKEINLNKSKTSVFYLDPSQNMLSETVLEEQLEGERAKQSIYRLKTIEGTTLNSGKKNDVILIKNTHYNSATNSSRQVFAQVPGLNIWESDQAGLQLEIGARGLSPQRTSNFNTRQNGYDISADAIGYPESYYTPPTHAVEKIQLIRGAASLQYGPQFGGMLNFQLKKGNPNKKAEISVQQNIGSFGLFSTYLGVGGQIGKMNYYTFGQWKTSKGWRPNSSLDSWNFFGGMEWNLSEKSSLKFEYTKLYYTAQQPGGLTDLQFEDNPSQSNRTGNWFQVDWNVFALRFEHRFSTATQMSSQFFGLLAKRNALGYLQNISWSESQFTTNRDLILSDFRNFGNETKLIHRYEIGKSSAALLAGVRYYQGFTEKNQGFGPSGVKQEFELFEKNKNSGSFYEFPSKNIAVFAENMIPLNTRWNITPGIRYEYIHTQAKGFNQVIDPNNGNVVKQFGAKNLKRGVLLYGLGVTYFGNENAEWYANFSKNYRGINFNDLYENNYNLVIDSNLKDESGFTVDIGYRGRFNERFQFDASVFYLDYSDRIGFLQKYYPENHPKQYQSYRFKTNISDSRTFGFDSYLSYEVLSMENQEAIGLRVFNNFTWQYGQYLASQEESIDGKKIELVPNINWKIGGLLTYKNWSTSLVYSYTGEQFSDAQNSKVSDNRALTGLIPSYHIVDWNMKYQTKNQWIFSSGVNNVLNSRYFTRRASGYPGPGIIPASPRNFYFSIEKTF